MSQYYDEGGLRSAFPEFNDFRVIAENDKGAVFSVMSLRRGFRVALKLTAEHGDSSTRSRFEREFDILFANQHHERLIHLYGDKGCRPLRMINGDIIYHYFFTMKLCLSDVSKALRERSLDLCSRVLAILQMLDGLSYLHAKKIVHRDIKPNNLFLEKLSPEEAALTPHPMCVKLGDFDIAKQERRPAPGETDQIIGTLYYLAPERWNEGKPDTDWRPSDQYAAGITAFQILSGGPLPLDFRDLEGDNSPLAYQRVHQQGNKLPLYIPERVDRGVPERFPRLERILYRMIATQPAERYEDIMRAKLALQAALASHGLYPCPHIVS